MTDTQNNYKEKYEVLFIEYSTLRHELDQLKRLVFGSRHERFVPTTPQEQLALGLTVEAKQVDPVVSVQTIEYTRTKKEATEKVQTGRMKLPANLPREQVILEPTEDVSGMKKIGEEITEELERIPGKLFVKFIQRQNRFLLDQYLIKNKGQKSLKRIEIKVEQKLVKGILLNNFLRPMNISRQELSEQMKTSGSDYDNFFNNLKHAYQSYEFLCRMGEALGTGGKFWLDLQTKENLDLYLIKHPYQKRNLHWNPPKHFAKSDHPIENNQQQPGVMIMEQYIKPSNIHFHHWADFFCMGPDTLHRIVDGRRIMDFRFISLLVKAFEKKASYWIELQNKYLVSKYQIECSAKNQIKPLSRKTINYKYTNLGNILVMEHLKPLDLAPNRFGKYIGGKDSIGHSLVTGKIKVGVEIAMKFSQALGTTPMYWLDLQMEEYLAKELGIKNCTRSGKYNTKSN